MESRANIRVEFLGPVRRPWTAQRGDVALPLSATVEQLLTELGYAPREQKHLSIWRNGEKVKPATTLVDGDTVTIALIVGGG